MTLMSQTTEPTRSVTDHIEAKGFHEALEQLINRMAAQEGHELKVVENEVTLIGFDKYEVFLRWMA